MIKTPATGHSGANMSNARVSLMKPCLPLAGLLGILYAPRVVAAGEAIHPVVVQYVAPPGCATSGAFQALVAADVARAGNPDRSWRFSVTIRQRDSEYLGTVATETGQSELCAPTCDELTEAMAFVIATAESPVPLPALAAPEAPPAAAAPTRVLAPSYPGPLPSAADVTRTPAERAAPPSAWRLGARWEHWADGAQIALDGLFLNAGVDVPRGFPKMHFEVGLGGLYYARPFIAHDPLSGMPAWVGLLDAQACPLDWPIGATGVEVLGCGRINVGISKGIHNNTNGDYGPAGWAGGGARVRWQSPSPLYVEVHFNGLYGQRIDGVPGFMDFGGGLGLRL
jgi:hypothetical protein